MEMNKILSGLLAGRMRHDVTRTLRQNDFRKILMRWALMSRSRHRPHQGPREKARRIGGETWQGFLAGDRVKRGLHARP